MKQINNQLENAQSKVAKFRKRGEDKQSHCFWLESEGNNLQNFCP